MTRRTVLSLPAALPALAAKGDAKIARVVLAPIECRFHKFVAMNSYDRAPKGHTYSNTLVRIQTDQGVEGAGTMGYPLPDAAFHAALKTLIGQAPRALYEWREGLITGRSAVAQETLKTYRHLDGPLFDLIGKLENKPAWRLIGSAVRDRVEVYDGTIYFSDVWFRDRGARAVVEECEEAARKGYKGAKLKLGRGSKWMERDQGLARDIEVCLAVRRALGPEFKILTDANNGYRDDFDRAVRLMEGTAKANLFWIEEIFPENVAMYEKFRAKLDSLGLKTLVADGENCDQPAEFAPYLEPKRLMDVVQLDIRRGGILDNLTLAGMAEKAGAVSVPHNWGSQFGGAMGLQVAKAVRAVNAAEDDRSTSDVLVADGYEFRGGMYTIPDAPGLSFHIDEDAYRLKCKAAETVIA